MKMDRAVFPAVRKNSPAAEAVGELCLDIEIYLEALEAVHAAGFGDGVQVSFASWAVTVKLPNSW